MKKINKPTMLMVALLLSSAPILAIGWKKSAYQQVPQGDPISRDAQKFAAKFQITDDSEQEFLNTVSETTAVALPDEAFDGIDNLQAFLAAYQIAKQRNKPVIAQQILNKMREKFKTGTRYQ